MTSLQRAAEKTHPKLQYGKGREYSKSSGTGSTRLETHIKESCSCTAEARQVAEWHRGSGQ